jgi:hypothetical protein
MTYNWKKILKNKTDKELYNISIGKSHLPQNITILAEEELRFRGITNENIQENKMKWTLKDEDETIEYYNYRTKDIRSKLIFYSVSFGIFCIINAIIGVVKSEFARILSGTIGLLIFLGMGFIFYFINKRELISAKKRHKRLIQEQNSNQKQTL